MRLPPPPPSLPYPTPGQDHADIYSAFEAYCAAEPMTGDNQYMVEGSGKHDADRFVRFETLPPVLHLHLKRFEFSMTTFSMEKVVSWQRFPHEIDLSAFLADDMTKAGDEAAATEQSAAGPSTASDQVADDTEMKDADAKKEEAATVSWVEGLAEAEVTAEAIKRAVDAPGHEYVLHSVLVHSGGSHGGHYFAFIRPGLGRAPRDLNEWLRVTMPAPSGETGCGAWRTVPNPPFGPATADSNNAKAMNGAEAEGQGGVHDKAETKAATAETTAVPTAETTAATAETTAAPTAARPVSPSDGPRRDEPSTPPAESDMMDVDGDLNGNIGEGNSALADDTDLEGELDTLALPNDWDLPDVSYYRAGGLFDDDECSAEGIEWFRFDDSRVYPVATREAMEGNFGTVPGDDSAGRSSVFRNTYGTWEAWSGYACTRHVRLR